MSTLIEANRPRFTFQVGGQSFRVRKFQGREMISRLFLFELELVSDDPEINFDSILNQSGLLKLQQFQDYDPRYVHGLVNHFEQRNDDGNYTNYYATLVPQVWLLTQRHDCRIFQQLDVQKILDKVLKEAGIPSDFYRFDLMNSHEEREYCVQYRETDWNFLNRLLEEEGMYGYFEHTESKHTFVMQDHSHVHPPIPSPDTVIFHSPSGYAANEEHLYFFHYAERLSSGKVTLRDFNFKRPSMDLEVKKTAAKETQLEVYDYPGLYEYDGPGQERAKVRLEGLQALRKLGFGESTCVRFLPGHQFTLEQHPRRDVNQAYLITAVTQEGEQPQVLKEQASGEGTKYHSQVQAVPADVSYRPLRLTPKPMVEGPQTAIVVGPKGEEIYVDEHGRVKVQFHWDRLGKKDEKSSCWIRVSQVWAGQSWGGVFIPRIGQEVIVDFLEGDPDRPIITGRVYHGENRPPYSPPQNKTKSTIKSNSSPGGGGFNELRFEDLKGMEEIFMHAQKDHNEVIENNMTTLVKSDQSLTVNHDRTKTIDHDETTVVKHDRTETVKNNEAITIEGTHTQTITKDTAITVKTGKYSHDVAGNTAEYHVKGDLTEKYDSNQSTKVSQSQTTKVTKNILIVSETADIQITAATQIQLTTGASNIVLKNDGTIQINGVNISINGETIVSTGTQEVTMNVGYQNVTCTTSEVNTQATKINTAAIGEHLITGALVKIN